MTDETLAGLYLHVPFCSAICPYCDFAVRRDHPAQRVEWATALGQEIELAAGPWAELAEEVPAARGFDTIYFGGGTPSLLDAEPLEQLLDTLRRRLPITPDVQLFFEANPEDVDDRRLALWRRLGISFLSLGIQAFDDDDLGFLGRRHGGAEAERALRAALAAGFETVSVDLIYGLPHHGADAWRRTLDRVAELGPQHLSCYELEIHPRTHFGKRLARGELVPLDEDRQAHLFELTHHHLAGLGYQGYEVSNFARGSEHRSRHNQKYWHHVPYLGLGPSAHSHTGRRRWWNEPLAPRWQKILKTETLPISGSETLDDADLALEAVMLGLRTAEGIDLDRLWRYFGVDLAASNTELLEDFETRGWWSHRPSPGKGWLVPTLAGMAVADGLASRLVLKPERSSDSGSRSDAT